MSATSVAWWATNNETGQPNAKQPQNLFTMGTARPPRTKARARNSGIAKGLLPLTSRGRRRASIHEPARAATKATAKRPRETPYQSAIRPGPADQPDTHVRLPRPRSNPTAGHLRSGRQTGFARAAGSPVAPTCRRKGRRPGSGSAKRAGRRAEPARPADGPAKDLHAAEFFVPLGARPRKNSLTPVAEQEQLAVSGQERDVTGPIG